MLELFREAEPESSRNPWSVADKLQLMTGRVAYVILSCLLATSAIYLALHGKVSTSALTLWSMLSIAIVGALGALSFLFKRHYKSEQEYLFKLGYTAVFIASGLCWAGLSVFITSKVGIQEQIICLLMLSVMAGAVTTALNTSHLACGLYISAIYIPAGLSILRTSEISATNVLLELCFIGLLIFAANWFSITTAKQTIAATRVAQSRKESEEEALRRLSAGNKSMPLAFMEFDTSFKITEWNPAAEKLFGISRENALNKHCSIFNRKRKGRAPIDPESATRKFFHVALSRSEPIFRTCKNAKGDLIDCDWHCSVLRDDHGDIVAYVAYVQDVSRRLEQQRIIEKGASEDELTGLPNRLALSKKLNSSINAAISSKSSGAVLFINIDEFKQINEAFGYGEGDEALQHLAKRMESIQGNDEYLARFGGDEFVVLLENLYGSKQSVEGYVAQRAAQYIDAATRAVNIKNTEFTFGASMGVCLFPDSESRAASVILRKASLALREVKGTTKGRAGFYDDALNNVVQEKIEILSGIRAALSNHEFKLFVQPKLSLADNRIIGGEALVRWHQPGKGMITPGVFIPILETSPYVYEFGEWTIREGAKLVANWQAQSICGDSFCLAINISARQLLDERFTELVARILRECGIPGRCLEFEITENVLIENFKKVESTLHRIRQMGVRIAIDDFGTGYSSLSYLQRLPVSTLKIDRSFIRDINSDQDNSFSIIKAILSMSQELDLTVVAEGVETSEQFEILQSLNCDCYQGFAFSPAVSAQRFSEFLSKEKRAAA